MGFIEDFHHSRGQKDGSHGKSRNDIGNKKYSQGYNTGRFDYEKKRYGETFARGAKAERDFVDRLNKKQRNSSPYIITREKQEKADSYKVEKDSSSLLGIITAFLIIGTTISYIGYLNYLNNKTYQNKNKTNVQQESNSLILFPGKNYYDSSIPDFLLSSHTPEWRITRIEIYKNKGAGLELLLDINGLRSKMGAAQIEKVIINEQNIRVKILNSKEIITKNDGKTWELYDYYKRRYISYNQGRNWGRVKCQ